MTNEILLAGFGAPGFVALFLPLRELFGQGHNVELGDNIPRVGG